ncbi:hypothetical protein Verru16b_02466 [Lacunisphaera limnophila]|uniref:DUF2071 domain-containing protein n=2 Tax=Lacunisphaera limnophila TaxID=1838286 RepID=A0A1D8AWV4_9BACT|nr:hypothetical protein Verru16b_02466 [Lacunisphaera limnophila]
MPEEPWTWQQAWLDLLFIHYEVDAGELRKLLPAGIELDLHAGKAWLGVVPFRMAGVTKRGWPAPPWLCDFAEINVRTYVRHGGKAGVWFLSLDVVNPLVAAFARTFFHLPYFSAQIRLKREGGAVHYAACRGVRRFAAVYEGGASAPSEAGSFAHWATERYCLYSADRAGRLYRGEVQHPQWPLQVARWELREDTMAPLPVGPRHPEVYYSPGVDVVVWPLRPIN